MAKTKEKSTDVATSVLEELVKACADEPEEACGCNEETSDDYQYVEIDVDDLAKITLNVEQFTKGVNSVSELCGKITALANVGIPPQVAMDYLIGTELNAKALSSNLEISKINAGAAVDSAKYGMATVKDREI